MTKEYPKVPVINIWDFTDKLAHLLTPPQLCPAIFIATEKRFDFCSEESISKEGGKRFTIFYTLQQWCPRQLVPREA